MWWRDYDAECAAWLATLPKLEHDIIEGGDGYEIRTGTWSLAVVVPDGWEDECRRRFGEVTAFSGYYGVIEV